MSTIRRRGHVLMVVGPDGTGKTTLCNALVQHVLGSVPVRVLANRRGAEPLGLLPGRAPRGNTSIPHRHQPRSTAVSAAKLLYSFTDILLGWIVKVRPFVHRGGWVVIERGGWDMLVDPRRYRLGHPAWMGRVLAWLLPRPSVVLVLEAPPEVITARKAQLAPAELVRQMNAWRVVLPAGQRRVFLDTSAPIPALLATIRGALAELDGSPVLARDAGAVAPLVPSPAHE